MKGYTMRYESRGSSTKYQTATNNQIGKKIYNDFKNKITLLARLNEYSIIKNDDDGYLTGDIINHKV